MYTDRWTAEVKGLYLIVVPNTSIKYDQESEEKMAHQAKMNTLQRIEEAKRKSLEKDGEDTTFYIFIYKFIV